MRKSFLIVVALTVTFIIVSGHAQQVTPPSGGGGSGMATNGSNATSGAAQNILTAAGSSNLLMGGALQLLNSSIYLLGVNGSSNSLHLRVDYSGTGGIVSFDNGPSFNTEASLSASGGFEIYGTSYSFTDVGGDKTTISNTPSGTHTFTIPNTTGTGITTGDTGTVTGTMLAASAVNLGGSTVTGTLPNTSVGATPLNAGTGATLVAPREYYVCTGACTVTPPVPAAGDEFCVYNDDNVATIITLAAIVGVQYETQARTSYKAADTSIASGGAIGDKMCIVGRDTTHYQVLSVTGTWN